MKTLSSILQQTSFELTQGDLAMEISSLTFDSRKAEKGSVFIAIVGTVSNGHDFVQAAYELGCRAFVVEKNVGLPSDATIQGIKVSWHHRNEWKNDYNNLASRFIYEPWLFLWTDFNGSE